MIQSGGSFEDCLLEVCNHNVALSNKIMDLELIVPKIVLLNNGNVMLWRCPENLLIDILKSQKEEGEL